MSAQTLTINYTSPSGTLVDDPLWLRLQQDNLADDVATVADAAAVLDALYDIEPCVETEETASLSVIDNPLTTDDLTSAAAVIDYSLCDQEPDGSVNVTVRIIRSDISWPYVLRITGGRVVAAEDGEVETPVEVRELYTQNITVESSTSVVLDYPVISGFEAAWQGSVIGENGQVEAPAINRNGTTLYWTGSVTGIIAVSFNTVYEVATIRVDGVDGEQGEALVRCFYHGLVEELTPELPESSKIDRSVCPKSIWKGDGIEDQVTCYQEVTTKTLCECSREEVDSRIEQQVQPCPEWAPIRCPNNDRECMHLLGSETAYEYVACAGDNEYPGAPGQVYALSTPKFYEDTCCKVPTVALPRCPEKKLSYRGGAQPEQSLQFYRSLYGPSTRLVPVSPPGGICGEHTIRQVIGNTNCCEGVPPLVWDTSISPEVISPNSAVIIGVTGGGRFSLTWTVSGHGFQFTANQKTQFITPELRVRLSALPIACGVVRITVTDGCSTVVADIRCTSGRWVVTATDYWPSQVIDLAEIGLFLCSSFGYALVPGHTSILQGRWWVGPRSTSPPNIVPITYMRSGGNLWASEGDTSPIMVPAPGTNGEVSFPAMVGQGPGYCYAAGGVFVDGVTLYWSSELCASYEWVC